MALLVRAMNAYYEKIPYLVLTKEIGYEAMFYSYFLLLGVKEITAEETTTIGRIDVVIEAGEDVYVIEIKVDQSVETALEQIKNNRYYAKYINTEKSIHLVGMDFSSEKRMISDSREEIIDNTVGKDYLNQG